MPVRCLITVLLCFAVGEGVSGVEHDAELALLSEDAIATDYGHPIVQSTHATRVAINAKQTSPGFRRFFRLHGGLPSDVDDASYIDATVDFGTTNSPRPDGLLPGSVDPTVGSSSTTTFGGPGSSGGIDGVLFDGGSFVIFDGDGDGAFTAGVDPYFLGYSDVSNFNISYEELSVEHVRGIGAIELMAQHLWRRGSGVLNETPAWRASLHGAGLSTGFGYLPLPDLKRSSETQKKRTDRASLSFVNWFAYGIRLNGGLDRFAVDGNVDFMGRTKIETEVWHTSIGPQFSLGRVASKGRWMTDLSGHITLGYGRAKFEQEYGIGQDLGAGALTQPLLFSPFSGANKQDTEHFAAHFELRWVTSYF
ncbi:MAG: hypothetical protein AAF589_03005, partial [Planctomycetota bacterium]